MFISSELMFCIFERFLSSLNCIVKSKVTDLPLARCDDVTPSLPYENIAPTIARGSNGRCSGEKESNIHDGTIAAANEVNIRTVEGRGSIEKGQRVDSFFRLSRHHDPGDGEKKNRRELHDSIAASLGAMKIGIAKAVEKMKQGGRRP
jgi:hypothetical protein